MAGTCTKGLLVLIAVLMLATSAAAASPDVSAMNLQPADVPGAKVVSQHSVTEQGYLSAHVRSFRYSAPNGSARLISIDRRDERVTSTL